MNAPPITKALPIVSAEKIVLSVPAPSGDHETPSHWAILLQATPPAESNDPTAINLLLYTARANTVSFSPEPNVSHLVPLYFAIFFPGVVNKPAAIRSPLNSTSEFTSPFVPGVTELHDGN